MKLHCSKPYASAAGAITSFSVPAAQHFSRYGSKVIVLEGNVIGDRYKSANIVIKS